ncbi:uncharacterized protein, partial [Chelonus insularis]|uniref:uncharacterized protein n=1 Tax=Chelonus insularis TaxID=460826 RepID=UPI00158BAA2E
WFTDGPSPHVVTQDADRAQNVYPSYSSVLNDINNKNTFYHNARYKTKQSTVALFKQGSTFKAETKLTGDDQNQILFKSKNKLIKSWPILDSHSYKPLSNLISTQSIEKNNNLQNKTQSNEANSKRSISSPQLFIKPTTRTKVYRKASLKSSTMTEFSDEFSFIHLNSNQITNLSNRHPRVRSNSLPKESKSHSDIDNIHIRCNPLSTPYPYSTLYRKLSVEDLSECSHQQNKKPSYITCGKIFPIFALFPQNVVSLQYLSPKIKFSWWRNKIS